MEDEFYDILFPPYTGHVKIGGLYYDLYIDRDTLERTAEVVRDPEASSERANYPDLTVARIPASVTYRDEQYVVTAIGNNAFEGCSRLSAVELPDTITGIGEMAFFGCEQLTSFVIPEGTDTIKAHAFSGCYNLTSVTIPASVLHIGENAFRGALNIIYHGNLQSDNDWGARWLNAYVDGNFVYRNDSMTTILECLSSATDNDDEDDYYDEDDKDAYRFTIDFIPQSPNPSPIKNYNKSK